MLLGTQVSAFCPTYTGSSSKRWILFALAVLLLFFSIALFSPLHRHTTGKGGGCSFNNLEHQWYSAAELAVFVLILVDIKLREVRDEICAALTGSVLGRRGRSPPYTR